MKKDSNEICIKLDLRIALTERISGLPDSFNNPVAVMRAAYLAMREIDPKLFEKPLPGGIFEISLVEEICKNCIKQKRKTQCPHFGLNDRYHTCDEWERKS